MFDPSFRPHDITTRGAIAASDAIELGKIASLAKTFGDGQCYRVAAITLAPTFAITAGAFDGAATLAGFRLWEMIRVQLRFQGHPSDFSHDCSGRLLRRAHIWEHGTLAGWIDPADVASGAGAVTRTGFGYIPFWMAGARRPLDSCPHADAFRDISLQIRVNALAVVNATAQSLTALRIGVILVKGDSEVPVPFRLSERIISTPQSFRLPVENSSRMRRLAIMVDSSQAAGTSTLAGSFEESVAWQVWGPGGEQLVEDQRTDDLGQFHNSGLYDAAVAESATVPEMVPFLGASRELTEDTKAPKDPVKWRFEASADPRDAATGTGRSVVACMHELYSVIDGGDYTDGYLRSALRTDPASVRMHPVAASKVLDVSPAKRDALPRRIIPLGK
jgi:hypothetical protein